MLSTVQVQSFTEYFQGDCTDPIAWLNGPNYFTAITEGWAAYAEDQLYPMDTKLYTTDKSDDKENKEILRQKYGMLYYQVNWDNLFSKSVYLALAFLEAL